MPAKSETRVLLEQVINDAKVAFLDIEKKHGVTLKISGGGYGAEGDYFDFKVSGTKTGGISRKQLEYEACFKSYNLPVFMSEFEYNHTKYNICGITRTGKKLEIKSQKDGKVYTMPLNLIYLVTKTEKPAWL